MTNQVSRSLTEKELNRTISVSLTMRDLIILNWGFEGVSWSESDNEAEWDAATAKIGAAHNALREKIAAG